MSIAAKLLIATIVLITLSLTSQAQDKKQAHKEKTKQKDHVCTQACHDSDTHSYAHGEKGHVCTGACKK